MATEATTAATHDGRRQHPPADAARRQEVRDVGADGDQLGVGEVDEVHHAEDQRDAERQQRVRAAATEAVDEALQQRRHSPTRRRSGRTGPRRAASSAPRPFGDDPPGAQHVATVGDLAAPAGRSARRPAPCGPAAQLDEEVEDDVDHARRQPERRLVEQQIRGSLISARGDGQLLGLAARQVAGRRRPPVGRGRRTARATSSSRRRRSACDRRDPGQLEVLLDGEVAEDPPSLGHEREAGAHERGRLGAGDVVAVQAHRARRRAQQPGDGVQQRRLAGAVRPDERRRARPRRRGATRRAGRDRAVARGQTLDLGDASRLGDVRRPQRLGRTPARRR